jgi:hypothetical protein
VRANRNSGAVLVCIVVYHDEIGIESPFSLLTH